LPLRQHTPSLAWDLMAPVICCCSTLSQFSVESRYYSSALFAGDIALRAFVGYPPFPMAAPTGGVVLILAWLALAVAAILALLHS